MTDNAPLTEDAAREPGELVREVWLEWAREQPDVAEHPSWLVPWSELTERDKDVDRRIESAIRASRPPLTDSLSQLSIRTLCVCGHEMQFHGNDNLCVGCMNTNQERHPFAAVRAESRPPLDDEGPHSIKALVPSFSIGHYPPPRGTVALSFRDYDAIHGVELTVEDAKVLINLLVERIRGAEGDLDWWKHAESHPDAALARLKPYLMHGALCDVQHRFGARCNCGLAAALAAVDKS